MRSLLLQLLLFLNRIQYSNPLKCYSCANDFIVWQWRHFFLKRNYALASSDQECVRRDHNSDATQNCQSTCFIFSLNGTHRETGLTKTLGVGRGCSNHFLTDDQHMHLGLGTHSKLSGVGSYLPTDFDKLEIYEHWCFCASDYCNTQMCYNRPFGSSEIDSSYIKKRLQYSSYSSDWRHRSNSCIHPPNLNWWGGELSQSRLCRCYIFLAIRCLDENDSLIRWEDGKVKSAPPKCMPFSLSSSSTEVSNEKQGNDIKIATKPNATMTPKYPPVHNYKEKGSIEVKTAQELHRSAENVIHLPPQTDPREAKREPVRVVAAREVAPRQVVKEVRRERRRRGEKHRNRQPPPPLNTFWDQDDQDFIVRKNMQRNQRRLHAMQERDEADDTLYEIPMRMPEIDFTRQTTAVVA